MVMSRLALFVASVGIVLFLMPASGPASSAPALVVPAAPAPPLPQLGILSSLRGQGVEQVSLVRIDPRTLRVRPGPRLGLGDLSFEAWSFSRDGARLAFAGVNINANFSTTSVRIVDSRRLRVLGRVRLVESGWVRATAWLPNGRLVAVVQVYLPEVQTEIVTVDVAGRKVLERQAFPGQVLRIARTPNRLVVLLSPADSLEPARLAIVGPTGAARMLVISQIRAGYEQRPGSDGRAVQREPGLAVDPDGRRAFVVATDGEIARVALRTGAISYHQPLRRLSVLGRVHAWLEPVAEAKLPREGSTRTARWLGRGLFAVSGGEYAVISTGNQPRSRFTPAGLRLIDTRSWTVRKLGAGTDTFWHVGNLLLAADTTWGGSELEVSPRPPGLIVYGADGRERSRLYAGKRVGIVYANAQRAFVSVEGRVDVIALPSGRVIERRASVAYPLVPPGAAVENS